MVATTSAAAPLPPLDDELGLHPLFFELPRDNVNFVKIIFESYESCGVVRAQDTAYAPGRVLMVVMLVPDFVGDGLRVAGELACELDMTFPAPDDEMLAGLKRAVLGELDEPDDPLR